MTHFAWRLILAFANFIVAALNFKAFIKSKESRDLWAAIAWCGSCSYWVWQTIIS